MVAMVVATGAMVVMEVVMVVATVATEVMVAWAA